MDIYFLLILIFGPLAMFLIAFVVLLSWVRRRRSTFFDGDITQAAHKQWKTNQSEAQVRSIGSNDG